MAKGVVITSRLDEELAGSLQTLAKRLGCSRAAVVAEAVREYVAEQSAFLDFVEVGERDIDEGRFHTQEEMEAWFEERIAARAKQAEQARAA